MSQDNHNEVGEPQTNPTPNAVEARAPSVVWDPVDGRGGLTWSGTGGNKLILHTTETRPEWGVPSYPYPPHLTINLDAPDQLWQHVTGSKGAYAMKSANPSPNYQMGRTYQVEHLGYAGDTPSASQEWYDSLAREVVWFHRNKDVPLTFAPVWEDGSAYGNWDGRMGADEFAAFSGVCGHQHAFGNDHWDPGRLNIPRLKEAIDEWMGTPDQGEEEPEMILVPGASGNAVKSLQRALNGWSEANKKGFKVSVDGTWEKGSAMTDHLKSFQSSLGLDKTGTLDGLTASYLVGRYDPPDI